MKTNALIAVVCIGALAGVALADPISPAREQFNFLMKLNGDWVLSPVERQEGKTKNDKVAGPLFGTDRIGMSFKVIGKASTVQENLLPGTAKEMATMYHCNDVRTCPQLVSKHYCAKQNQPELVAKVDSATNKLMLTCDMSTALCNSNDDHVHMISHELSNNGRHLTTTYTSYKDGKKKGDTIYHFDRKL